jgi:hypothetical protein
MFVYLNWVADLQGISPVARLLGIRMANYASYVPSCDWPASDEPACIIDLEGALAWIGCSESELQTAMIELAEEGVRPLFVKDRKILYSFPVVEEWEASASSHPKRDTALSIYVISAQSHVSKIGISKYPDYRLQNLQAANPTQRLNMPWRFVGPSSIIRRTEREAHAKLAIRAIGNEWFSVEASEAICTVQKILEKAGLNK